MFYWLALALCVLANISASVALKNFANGLPDKLSVAALLPAALSPSLWIGLMCGGILVSSYIYALRGLPLSLVYPLATGLTALGIISAGVFIYGEAIGFMKAIGLLFIICGSIVVLA
ncbi:MAG: hypothetical protein AAGC70_15975 [Pseudomonadota bacterium]